MVLSDVLPSVADTPVSVVITELMDGVPGAVVSMVMIRGVPWIETFPAASVVWKVRLCAPSASVGVVKFHVWLPAPAGVVVVPIDTPLSKTLTLTPPSAVPVRVSTVALVIRSPRVPVSGVKEPRMPGAGAAVSMVICSWTLPSGKVWLLTESRPWKSNFFKPSDWAGSV